MTKLTKKQEKEKSDLEDGLTKAHEALADAIKAFNDARAAEWGKVEAALTKYNAAVEEANDFRSNVNTEQEDYFTEKSEKWQEGDNGAAYDQWKENWALDLEEAELEPPEDVEVPEDDAGDQFRELEPAP